MKTIQVSDEDYKTLMELSKELQTQENDYQAFPYFWEPSSYKREIDPNDEGEYSVLFDYNQCERFTPIEYKENFESSWIDFCEFEEIEVDSDFSENEQEYLNYLEDNFPIRVYTENDVQKQEHNPSLFKSDVKNFIQHNKHHLGRDPHTYSRSIWRMPKMETLVGAILRINKNHNEEINHEAKRFTTEASQ